jgi:hypothetical protein
MTDWLVYWKTYWEKVDDPRKVEAHWHSSYELLYQVAQPGDVIWVVVSGPEGNETQWRLLEHLAVRTVETIDEAVTGYKYRFVGDKRSHEVFNPKAPDDLTPILTSLTFASNRPIRFSGKQIGRSLQHARELAESDAELLRSVAKNLPPVDRFFAAAGQHLAEADAAG